jgi:hypothetical protein
MQAYDNLVELARLCLEQSRKANNQSVSAELMYLAKGHQLRAAAMDNGALPDNGEAATSTTVKREPRRSH